MISWLIALGSLLLAALVALWRSVMRSRELGRLVAGVTELARRQEAEHVASTWAAAHESVRRADVVASGEARRNAGDLADTLDALSDRADRSGRSP